MGRPSRIPNNEADGFYAVDAPSTVDLWASGSVGRPVELSQLATALRHDPDLIYEYVHNSIETVPMYGLQKGALGAIIDQSGTAFDQVQLMVELLRESGYTAKYKVGAITLNGDQVVAWFGITGAAVLARVLGDGGIPAVVTPASGTITTATSVTIAHVWVQATIPGSSCGANCWFDPAYKTHVFKSGSVDLGTAMQWNETQFLADAQNGMTSGTAQASGTTVAAPYVAHVNETKVRDDLTTYSTNLLTYLKANASTLELRDMIGGAVIQPQYAQIRQASTLPYATSVKRTWTGNIPDKYRTKLRIELSQQFPSNPILMDRTLFADEFYGRRMRIDPGHDLNQCALTLEVDDRPLTTANCTGQAQYQRDNELRLTLDHPYAAPDTSDPTTAGTYMDRVSVVRADFFQPVTVVVGLGHVSPSLLSKISSEHYHDDYMPVPPNPPDTINADKPPPQGTNHARDRIAASWLAQFTRLTEFQAQIASLAIQHHHSLGIVALDSFVNVVPCSTGSNPPQCGTVGDSQVSVSIVSGLSVNSITNTPNDRKGGEQTIALAAAALEGSLTEQVLDTPLPASTATRFEWGNAVEGNLTRYYLFDQTNFGTSGSLFYSAVPSYGDRTKTLGGFDAYNRIKPFIDQGFWVLAVNQDELGPGNMWRVFYTLPPLNQKVIDKVGIHRGPAFIAFRPDASEIAHIVTETNKVTKGGGAGQSPDMADELDPKTSADLLKDKFKDRSRDFGIDLKTGELTYTPPADISVGNGGFPYQLTLQRTFHSSTEASPGLGSGWTHNLDIRTSLGGSGLDAMGEQSPMSAAPTLVALYVGQQLYKQNPQLDVTTLKRWIVAPFVAHWWTQQLTYNVATVTEGTSSKQFVRMPDGSFLPPKGNADVLVQTGQRQLEYSTDPDISDEVTRWLYGSISFTLTKPDRSVQSFGRWAKGYRRLGQRDPFDDGQHSGWHLDSWSFPYGMSVTFTYEPDQGEPDHLVSVQNNLGRTLTFRNDPARTWKDCTLRGVSDGTRPEVTFSSTCGSTVTSPEGEVTKYEYDTDCTEDVQSMWIVYWYLNNNCTYKDRRPNYAPALRRVFKPSDLANARLEFDYDALWRVATMRDAVSVRDQAVFPTGQLPRPPYTFFATGTTRGQRVDPMGGAYTVYYSDRGLATRFVDELARETDATYDGQDRVIERDLPATDRYTFEYDAKSNLRKITHFPKSGTGSEIVQASYHPTCNGIASVTDARNNTTDWTYNSTTCTLTNIQQPAVLNPATGTNVRPLTAYGYNAYGQRASVTDPTNVQVTYDYYGTEAPSKRGYRKTRTLDPGTAPHVAAVTTYDYDPVGNVTLVTDPKTYQTSYQYDNDRRLKVVAAPECVRTENYYTPDGSLDYFRRAKKCSPGTNDWALTDYDYTPTGLIRLVTDPALNHTSTEYDDDDRPSVIGVEVTPGQYRKAKTIYDAAGQVIQKVQGWQSADEIVYASFAYTPGGNLNWQKDANGNKTDFTYDRWDRPQQTRYPSKTAPGTVDTSDYEAFDWDPNGNRLSRRNRDGVTITYQFDALNRETFRTVPANLAGNFARTLTSTYDLAGRKWDLTADGQTLKHRYDTAGRLDTVDDTLLESLNALDPLLGKLDYDYDKNGNRALLSVTGGASSYAVVDGYDTINRLTTVQEKIAGVSTTQATYQYDTLSRRDFVTWGNGVTTDYVYEDDDDLSSLTHVAGTTTIGMTLTRNGAHEITLVNSTDGSLIRPSTPVSAQSHSYINNGQNQLSQVDSANVIHDPNGNLTQWGNATYEYDEENRLRKATVAGVVSSYGYDPLGRRRSKTVGSSTTYFISDDTEEIAEISGAGTIARRYLYGPEVDDRILFRDVGSNIASYYLSNFQASPIAITGATGSVLGFLHYGPYGESADSGGVGTNPFRYSGRRYDDETALYYYRARYYSSSSGRFLQVDPIAAEDSINLYTYVEDDPVNQTDPSGNCGPACIGFVLGAGIELARQSLTGELTADTSLRGIATNAGKVLAAGAAGAVGAGIGANLAKVASAAVIGTETLTATAARTAAANVVGGAVGGGIGGAAASSSQELMNQTITGQYSGSAIGAAGVSGLEFGALGGAVTTGVVGIGSSITQQSVT